MPLHIQPLNVFRIKKKRSIDSKEFYQLTLDDSSFMVCNIAITWGLLLPMNPMVTTVRTVVAPRVVRASISPPISVFVSQNCTHEQHTIRVRGMYI